MTHESLRGFELYFEGGFNSYVGMRVGDAGHPRPAPLVVLANEVADELCLTSRTDGSWERCKGDFSCRVHRNIWGKLRRRWLKWAMAF